MSNCIWCLRNHKETRAVLMIPFPLGCSFLNGEKNVHLCLTCYAELDTKLKFAYFNAGKGMPVIYDKDAGIDHTDKSFSTAVTPCVALGCNETGNEMVWVATHGWMCMKHRS